MLPWRSLTTSSCAKSVNAFSSNVTFTIRNTYTITPSLLLNAFFLWLPRQGTLLAFCLLLLFLHIHSLTLCSGFPFSNLPFKAGISQHLSSNVSLLFSFLLHFPWVILCTDIPTKIPHTYFLLLITSNIHSTYCLFYFPRIWSLKFQTRNPRIDLKRKF